ncbi:hypothetical protein AOC36_02340 [Erysipelothrix larvae]|uniref:RNA polymerase subunit sigma-24 n=1 Tax=Erysipelothrix larvae TaxID=1514105 RepID=A0A109UGP0_9FIRM|nr:RNA polymerase sigma factor [Erysipelothrix larvae]AMC92863.1 hypothetical protein AOC36_02340 [Erysipelothrix larvae]
MGTNEVFSESLHELSDYLKKIVIGITGNHPDVEDLVAETIYKAYKNRFRLRNPDYLKTYVTRIQINVCKDYLKKHQHYIEYDDTIGSNDQNPEDYHYIHEALDTLPTEIRELIVLHYILEVSYVELSKIMKVPQSTLKSRVKKGLEILRVELEEPQ